MKWYLGFVTCFIYCLVSVCGYSVELSVPLRTYSASGESFVEVHAGTVPINSVFDHSISGRYYGCDEYITAYTGERAWSGRDENTDPACSLSYKQDSPVPPEVFDERGFDNGDVYVCDSNEVFERIQSEYYPLGEALNLHYVRVSRNSARSENPALATDSKGWNYVVWEDDRDGNWEIYFRIFHTIGYPVTQEIRVTNTPGASRNADIDVDESGNSHIVWQEDSSILLCVIDETGSVVLPARTLDSGSCSNPSIAVRPDGTSHVVWEKTTITIYRVYFNQFDVSGNPLGSHINISRNDIIGIVPKAPRIDLDDSGNSYILWRDAESFTAGLYYCRVNADRSIYTSFRIIDQGDARFPCVGISGNEYLNMLFQDGRTGRNQIYYIYNVNDDRQISVSPGSAEAATVAGDPTNRDVAFAAWQDNREGSWEVYLGQVSPETGQIVGSLQRVSFEQHDSTAPDISVMHEIWYAAWQDTKDGNSEIYLSRMEGWPPLDTDEDAIPDAWETATSENMGGAPLPLAEMGAVIGQRDIFVEIDWLTDGIEEASPNEAALQEVAAAFDDRGYALHLDYGQGGVAGGTDAWCTGGNAVTAPDLDIHYFHDQLDFPELHDMKWRADLGNFDSARERVFHYCLYAKRLLYHTGDLDPNCSIQSPSGASTSTPHVDFVVCPFYWDAHAGQLVRGEMFERNTFMHELGHNLGLKHGGFNSVNFKPNYLSIMNYLFQAHGLFRDGKGGVLDYSPMQLPPLNEDGALDEVEGLGPLAEGYGTRFMFYQFGPLNSKLEKKASRTVDWNGNEWPFDTDVREDVNGSYYLGCKGLGAKEYSVLAGWNDWDHLDLSCGNRIGFESPAKPIAILQEPAPLCPSATDLVQLPLFPPSDVSLSSSPGHNQVAWTPAEDLGVSAFYTVYRSTNGAAYEPIGNTSGTGFEDTNIETGIRYSYVVTVTSIYGVESPYSEPASAPTATMQLY